MLQRADLRRLSALCALKKAPHPAVILTTSNAVLQKLPPQAALGEQVISARPGNQLDMNDLAARLERNGFERVSTVRDIGEYAVRGGILDLYAPGAEEPLRLDFSAIRWKRSVPSIPPPSAPPAPERNSCFSR